MLTKLDAALQAGFIVISETDKVFQLRCGKGKKIYLTKSNLVDVVVDPLDPVVSKIKGGVGFLNEAEYFNSNMREFPEKINKGKSPTRVGRKILFGSPHLLTDFLVRYSVGV